MVIPAFSDIGKSARDVFKTGYHYGKGLIKLGVKTKSDRAFELDSDFVMNFEASKSTGSMESRYKTKEYGTFSEKWATDGTLFTEYSIDGKPTEGLGFSAAFVYNAAESKQNLKLGAKYRDERLNVGCTLANAFDSNVKMVGAAVAGYKDFLIGYQAGYDTSTSKVTKNDIAVAYNLEDLGIHLRCTSIPYEYGLSVFHKVNSDWETVINGVFAKNGNSQQWTVGAGARYKIDEGSMLRFKFNKDLQLGTSLQQKIRDGITVTLSFNLDCANVTKGGHKVGLALDLEA